MRIHTFRAWVNTAVQNGIGAARRAGVAISRRVREATGRVDAGAGVGEDESSFGGGRGSRAWMELVEEYVQRVLQLFERSKFERRFAKVEALLRKMLGLPEKKLPAKIAPPVRRPPGAISATKLPNAEQAARFRAQVQAGMIQAHTREQVNLRQLGLQREEDQGASDTPEGGGSSGSAS